jgi:hypothetical protein
MRPLPLAALVVALVLASCSQRPRPERERFSAASARVDVGQFPDARAILLLDRTSVTLYPPDGKANVIAEVTTTRRTQIVSAAGLDQAMILVPYDERARVAAIASRVLHPDGSIEETHADAFVDVERFAASSPAGRLYDGKGYKMSKVRGAQVGDIIETVVLRLVRDPRWLEPILIGGELPFVRGEVVVDVPKGFDVDFRVTKLGRVTSDVKPTRIPVRVKSVTDKMKDPAGMAGSRYAFVFDGEPALFPEGAAPAPSALATQVHVQLLRFTPDRANEGQGFSSFDDVASWYRELTKGKDQPDGITKQLMRGMNKAAKNDKLRSVQRYLQDDVADVPTFLNLAALPAHASGDIVKAKIGDAKDQASLGLALLRQLGIDGFPVLVSRAGSFASVPDIATPAPFNHVVIAVPMGGAYAFIDPSTPGMPTGRLPGALQGQKGVLVRNDGGELIDLPEDAADDNVNTIEVELEMQRDGSMTGVVRAALQGVDAATGRACLADADNGAAKLRTLLLGDTAAGLGAGAPDLLPGLELVDAFRVAGRANDPDEALKLQIRARPLPPYGDPFVVIPERAVGRPLAFLWREGRKAPVVLDHRAVYRVKLSVRMPEGKGVQGLPASLQKTGSILNVEENWAVADGQFWLARTLRVEERIVPPERYDELRQAATALWARQQTPITLVDGGDRGAAYHGDPF